MCGIVGYAGEGNTSDILISGMEKLEYRGYDSAGISVLYNNKIDCIKKSGRVSNLSRYINSMPMGNSGIGHTRWATHGEPDDINAHPHISFDKKFAVVHNGIIENYIILKEQLIENGIQFISETDTEVIPNLLSYHYDGDVKNTILKVISLLRGSYAFAVLSTESPGTVFAVKNESPLVVGVGNNENFIASDIAAFNWKTDNYVFPEDKQLVFVSESSVVMYDNNKIIVPKPVKVEDDTDFSNKSKYQHYMLKEMYEQGKAVRNTLKNTNDVNSFKGISKYSSFKIVACGSAYHVAVTAKYIIEKLCRVPTEVIIASEFRYKNPILKSDELVIAISQSGETADTLAALREAKKRNIDTLAIVNVKGCSMSSISDKVIYTRAGTEIAVATTKAYSAQLVVIYTLALNLAYEKGKISKEELDKYNSELNRLPDEIEKLCEKADVIKEIADNLKDSKAIFYIGLDYDYATAMEGSLKLKEISYISSEAYAAGELKHGTISLIDKDTVVVSISTVNSVKSKMFSNIKEVKARKAKVFAVCREGDNDIEALADYVFKLPEFDEIFYPSLSLVPLQFYAYYTALLNGKDIDKPRNLAKSVTVE